MMSIPSLFRIRWEALLPYSPFSIAAHIMLTRLYSMGAGPAYRIIANPANWDASLSIIPSGESGQPFSPYYADQIEAWLAVEYHTLPFTLPAVETAAQHTLRLTP